MIGLTLFCRPGQEHFELEKYTAGLWEFLKLVTEEALGADARTLEFRIIPGTAWKTWDRAGLKLVAEVGRGKTPKQDMAVWRQALMTEWETLRQDERFRSVWKILRQSISFQTQVVDADYGELEALKD